MLKSENHKLKQRISELEADQKEKDIENKRLKAEIKQLKLQCLDVSKYQEWNHQEIGAWIMGLDDGRFVKYKKVVMKHLE